MLNPFPIQFLAMFAYLLLRLFVGGILLYLGLTHLHHRTELKDILKFSWFPYGKFATWMFALTEILLAGLILMGIHLQYAAIILMIMSLKLIVLKGYFKHPSIPPRIFYILLFAVALSLFITGAGVLAFDLPV